MPGSWSSNVPISMPVPPEDEVLVDMAGFAYTQFGLVHDMTHGDYMVYRLPSHAPDVLPDAVVHDDAALDAQEGDFF